LFWSLGQEPQPHILRGVGVLVFVDEYVFELAMVFGQHVVMLAENADGVEQQVAEIAGVQRGQPFLIGTVEFAAAAIGEGAGVPFRNLVGGKALILPGIDHLREGPRRPTLVVQPLGLDQLLDQAGDVVGVEDGEIRAQTGQFGMAAQQLDADGVEGAQPWHALDRLANKHADAVLHLARRLVGEGDGEDLAGEGAASGQDMGDAGGEHARLAGARARQHQYRAFSGFHRLPLFGIETLKIFRWVVVALTRRHGASRNAGRGCLRGRCTRGVETRSVVLVEEGHVVIAGHFVSECSDSGEKGQQCSHTVPGFDDFEHC
jgi:hypothetical protein